MANKFIIHGLSEEGKAMRSALVKIQKRHESWHDGYDIEGNPAYSCYECSLKYPCPTRKLADEALGGGERG